MLAVLIPYYKNSEECEIAFKKLMKTLVRQVTDEVWLIVYEDGQRSEWLREYSKGQIVCNGRLDNVGVARARNILLGANEMSIQCDYILFIDSDDMVDCDFIKKMLNICRTKEYDMIISDFIYQNQRMDYQHRYNVAGVCLRTDFIKGIYFDERYNISEDTIFINKVYERNPKIFMIDSNYYYNYGINKNSLMMRFERSEIGLMKDEKDKGNV